MTKDYQKTTASAGISEELVLPDAVTVAMAEIARWARSSSAPLDWSCSCTSGTAGQR